MRAFAFLALCLIAAGCSAREQDPSPGGPAPSPTPGPTATSTPASTPAPPSSGSDSFQVVRITGEIRGQGPPYAGPVAVCGQPYFGAAIDFGGSRLEVVRDEALPAKFRLVVAHEVRLDDPAARGRCGPWTTVRLDADGNASWRLAVHGEEVRLQVRAAVGGALVDGQPVPANGSRVVPVAFDWTDPETNAAYRYEGNLTVASLGAWRADAVRIVERSDDLTAARAVREIEA